MDNPQPQTQTKVDRIKIVAKKAALPIAFVTTAAVSARLGWKSHDNLYRPVFELMARHTEQHEKFADKAEAFIDSKGLYSEFRKYIDQPIG